jgi:hypothetical protein
VRPPTMNGSVSALRFFFTVTLDRPNTARTGCACSLPRRPSSLRTRRWPQHGPSSHGAGSIVEG